jgi:RNase P subunit RPR2
MKVIEEGRQDWQPWWIGKRLECKECGRVVELEPNDDVQPNWIDKADYDRVVITCEKCGHVVSLTRKL